MRIRGAETADLEAIEALLRAADLPVEGVREHLDRFLVGDDGGAIVAVAGVEGHGRTALVRSVAVDASRRGTGLGRAIVGALLDRARGAGHSDLFLLTTTAETFFTRFGFITAPREQAPPEIRATAEFTRLCPASAVFMRLAPEDERREQTTET